MKTALIFAAAVSLMPLAANAQSVGEKTGINSALGVSPTTPDFVKEVAMSDMFEIQSSQVAAEKGNTAVKAFAQHMIMDHQKTSGELKGMVSSGKVTGDIPAEMASGQKSMIDKLKTADGDDFNKLYVSDQVSAHKDAVSLFDRYGKGGDNDGLKTWAAQTLPTLQEHLKMAQDLQK